MLPVFLCFGWPADAPPTCGCAARISGNITAHEKIGYDVVYRKTEVSDASSQGPQPSGPQGSQRDGSDGWELVSVAQDQEQVRLFLKRELPTGKA